MNQDMEEKGIDDLRNADMSAASQERASKPQKTWFFERMGDGFVFPVEEDEAWQICYNKSTWKRRDFKLLGTSDGTTYKKIADESMDRAKELVPVINKKKDELSKYMRAEEKLIMDEAVDMDGDPSDTFNEANKQKVLRLRSIMDRLHTELNTLEAELRSVTSGVVKRAQDAELAQAQKNQADRIAAGMELDWPDYNKNIITPDTDPHGRGKILNLIAGRAK